jgi:hypothetical protein
MTAQVRFYLPRWGVNRDRVITWFEIVEVGSSACPAFTGHMNPADLCSQLVALLARWSEITRTWPDPALEWSLTASHIGNSSQHSSLHLTIPTSFPVTSSPALLQDARYQSPVRDG